MPRYRITTMLGLEVAATFDLDALDEDAAGREGELIADRLGVHWRAKALPGSFSSERVKLSPILYQEMEQTATLESIDLASEVEPLPVVCACCQRRPPIDVTHDLCSDCLAQQQRREQ